VPALASVLPHTISPYLTLMIVGFCVGILGHLYRSRTMVGVGIGMIFAATLLLPLALVASDKQPPSSPGIYAPGTR
jgi:hypothetical protein